MKTSGESQGTISRNYEAVGNPSVYPYFEWLSGPRCAAAVWNSDGTPQNIQQIHDTQAQNGDTITIPAGTFTWSTGITITKAITLQGAGVGSTIIKDSVQSAQLIQWSLPAAATCAHHRD